MNTSEGLTNLAPALIAAQKQMPAISKNTPGHGYKYASLDDIMPKIRPVLADNGLAIVQMINGTDMIGLTTRLIHESGEWLEDTIYAPPDDGQRRNSVQAAGSTITYLRRYGIAALLGLADETDTDGVTEPAKNGHADSRGAASPQAQAQRQRPTQDIKPPMPTEAMKKKFHALGSEVYGDEWDDRRPALVEAVSHKREGGQSVISSNDLYRAEMQLLIDGMNDKLANIREAANGTN